MIRNSVSLGLVGALACILSTGVAAQVQIQNLRNPPVVGGTGGLALPDAHDSNRYRGQPNQHKTVTGQPCVSVNGLVKSQIVNPQISEHVLLIANTCSQPIALKACYYQSTTCFRTTIAGYSRRQQTLGFSADKDFRFSYTEEFN